MVKGRKVAIALDRMEEGSEDGIGYGVGERVSARKVPDGIASRELYSDIIRIAWPSLIELILTQLASMVDQMMVGGLGTWALSAVGLCNQPKFLLMSMVIALNVGATAMVARSRGANQQEKANHFLRQALFLTLILSLLMSVLGYVFAEPMIRFMGGKTDEQTIAAGIVYLRIQMIGFAFVCLTMTATATLRGVGNSRTAMIYNMVANVVNVILNYLLIEGHFGFPRMEVVGASLATIIGQFVAFVMAMYTLIRGKSYIKLTISRHFRVDIEAVKAIAKVGIPAMIEQLIMRAGMIIYTKQISALGTDAFATHNACMSIHAMTFQLGQGFSVASTSLIGQSLGKRRPDMAECYSIRTQRLGLCASLVLAAIGFFLGESIVGLYLEEQELIAMGGRIMMMVALMQPFMASQLILAGSLRGAGDTKATAIITFLTILCVRPIIAHFAINTLEWSVYGAWFAMVIDQLVRSLLISIRYRKGAWKSIKVDLSRVKT